ncbi:ATP-binding cassette domain-containing protein [Streptosporangium sp. NPDC002721]|uniref:ATP-binding cassette domain-containing protein n=1 Tax=Streptosporangium sp. NPDC002721 TaxID=3366188 RepID=UPI0036C92C0A
MTLLSVENLTVGFGAERVVDGVAFSLGAGERLGLIGESGSGKTLTALALAGLLPPEARARGSVRLDSRELLGLRERSLARLRGDRIGFVFQEPLTALNPSMRVGAQIVEPLRIHRGLARRPARAAAVELAARVGLPDPDRIVRSYPHQLSGGQRQRAGIAIALACRPALIVADEPTTALDVTVQAEILRLLTGLVREDGSALLFISHDLAVVAQVAERVAVMRDGRIIEEGPTLDVLRSPGEPYTKELVTAARALTWTGRPPGTAPETGGES